jgi:hypothetical protein
MTAETYNNRCGVGGLIEALPSFQPGLTPAIIQAETTQGTMASFARVWVGAKQTS